MPRRKASITMKPSKRRPSAKLATANAADRIDQDNVDIKAMAKRFFHRSFQGRTVGRIEQKASISNFLDGPFGQKGLYIAGHPGTGKTAVVTELLLDRPLSENFMVNCIIKGSVKAVVHAVLHHFQVSTLNELKNVCLIFDEIDFLVEKDFNLVQSLYNRTDMKIIGIANTLDLAIDKFPDCSHPLSFPPYSIHDITAIMAARLECANQAMNLSVKLLDPLAIELCARKVAATGDLRRALDIIQLAIDASDLKSVANGGVLIDVPLLIKTLDKACPVRQSMSKVCQLLDQCNLHQKIILLSLIIIRRSQLEARPTLLHVMQEYLKVLNEGRMADALTRSDFLDAISNLDALGLTKSLVSNVGKQDKWSCKVYMEVDPQEVSNAIGIANPLLAALLAVK